MLKIGSREEKDVSLEQGYGAASAGLSAAKTGGGERTVIGENISIEGTVRADEDIIVEGALKGTVEVKSHQLTVGPKGRVEADVTADGIVISGRMVGNLNARGKVHVTKNADFSGQIKAKRISIEDGAFIKASIELERDQPPQAPAQRQTPAATFAQGMESGKTAARPEFPLAQAAK